MPASLELVRIALQAYANGDCEIALALADPLIRWDERASRLDGDLVWRKRDVERAMRQYLDGWKDYRFDLEDLAEVGPGKVVGICRERGRPKEGVPVDRRFGGLWVVQAGKIVSWTTYLTPKEAVRAAKELLGGRIDEKQIKRRTGPAARPPAEAPAGAGRPEVTTAAEQPEVAEPESRPRKKAITLSEEQKRAARARAQLRRRASRRTA